MASFSVTSSSSTLALGPAQPGGAFDLRVTNQSGFTLTARVQAESQQNPPFLKAELVASDGGALDSASPTVELKANAWVAYRLRVTAEPKLAPGTYTFLVKAINTADTDSDIGLSETLSVTIPEVRKPPLPSWLAFAIVGALLVIGGTVAAVLGTRKDTFPMPDLTGMKIEEAKQALQDSLLRVGDTTPVEDATKVGMVVGQDPKEKDPVEAFATVNLTLGVPPQQHAPEKVDVPKGLINLTFTEARDKLSKAGLVTARRIDRRETAARIATRAVQEIVTAVSPGEGEPTEKGKTVFLSIKQSPIGKEMEAVEVKESIQQILLQRQAATLKPNGGK